jgi:hypothetical protein
MGIPVTITCAITVGGSHTQVYFGSTLNLNACSYFSHLIDLFCSPNCLVNAIEKEMGSPWSSLVSYLLLQVLGC